MKKSWVITIVGAFMLLGGSSNISADTSSVTTILNFIQISEYQRHRSVTGGFDGFIYESQPASPAIPVQATEFKPQTVVVDVYEADTTNFKWGVGVYNLTTMEEEVPFVPYIPGTSQMILPLKNAKQNDELGVYVKASSGEGHVSLRATLSPLT